MQWYHIHSIHFSSALSISDFRILSEAEGSYSNPTGTSVLYIVISTSWKRNTGRPLLTPSGPRNACKTSGSGESHEHGGVQSCTKTRVQLHALAHEYHPHTDARGLTQCVPICAWHHVSARQLGICFNYQLTPSDWKCPDCNIQTVSIASPQRCLFSLTLRDY